ncbi:MAG: reprolysin-like metallopeptidase [Pyrinomonadaceae bacterium]
MKSINYATKLFAFTLLSAIILITAISPVFAEKDKNKQSKSPQPKLWRQINEDNLQSRGAQRAVTPEKYRVFQLDQTILKNSLTELPFENTDAARENPLIIEMPMPDGSLQRFRMEQTAVLSPELAAQYPDWKTFVGYGVDDTAAVGRFDWNAFGFHGYIETDKGIVFIDPYQKGDTKNYLVFYKHEFGKPLDDFSERVDETMSKIVKSDYQSFTPQFSFGASLRTYRLAIATTGEWSRNAAGYTAGQPVQTTRDNALAVVVTSVNRLIGIYTRELSSSFQLVNPPTNNDANNIIFDDPATDPYDNSDNTAQLTINQTTIDNSVGTENYDIGHLFGTGGGGVASSPSICSTQKAEGYSARDTNTGDPFVVDYVAHEMGHQFGADHTYNNLDPNGACTTRSMTDAFEVGSGSTIMSYVGICNQRNLQQFNDFALPTFHIRSLTTINTNITTGDPQTNNCGTASGTNNIPTVSVNGVNAGNTFTIPALTPFTLTATGNDADAGDVANLLYSWEEYDLAPSASGASGTPAETYDVDTDGVLRPLFRAYSPVAGNSRTFPSMAFILNPANNDPAGSNQPPLTYMGTHPTNAPGAVCETGMTCVVGERLPTVARTMNFRVSLRDRRGGVADAGTTVTVADGTGPFQVTVQNSFNNLSPAVTWQGGTMQTVTWDVANTNAAPINAANVNILLSTDGGQTFPITILANTLNDGTEQITVPNNPTTTARIKVEAVGNIFFDINNADFTISAPTAASVSVSGRVSSARGRGIAGAVVRFTNQDGNTRFARTNPFGYYNFADLAAGQTYIFSVSAKGFRFEPRVVSLTENLAGFDFIAR